MKTHINVTPSFNILAHKCMTNVEEITVDITNSLTANASPHIG